MISVGFTLPFSEGNAQYDELKDIAGDFETENPNRYNVNKKDSVCENRPRY